MMALVEVAGSQLRLGRPHLLLDAAFRLHQLGGLRVGDVLLLLPFGSPVLEPYFHLETNIKVTINLRVPLTRGARLLVWVPVVTEVMH